MTAWPLLQVGQTVTVRRGIEGKNATTVTYRVTRVDDQSVALEPVNPTPKRSTTWTSN